MNKKVILFIAFVFAVLIQMVIPFKLIYDKEDVLNNGSEFKFITSNVGSYNSSNNNNIHLDFKDEFKSYDKWNVLETAYVCIKNNNDGFAYISSISREKPIDTSNYIKVTVSWYNNRNHTVYFKFPFTEFYLKESIADEVKGIYNKSIKDSSKKVYALVSIKNGKGVLKDLLVDGVPILNMLEK